MSDSLANGQLMSTLAEAAATFVAIVAGFYTTKIFSIKSDKNRLDSSIKQLKLEKEHISLDVNYYKSEIQKIDDKELDEYVEEFIDELKNKVKTSPMVIHSKDDIIKYYKELSGNEPSEKVVRKIENKIESESLMEELKKLEKERKRLKYHEYVTMTPPLDNNPATRIIAHQEREKYDELVRNYQRGLSKLTRLEEQIESSIEDQKHLILPEHLIIGFSSFVIFAILGVIFPLTSQLWNPYVKQYFEPDLFYLILFGIGLTVTLAYIGIETFSVFDIKKRIFAKKGKNELAQK
jgi:hypothetical protein